MYLKSAWRALGKIYYNALQIGNTKEFLLDDNEKDDEEAKFRASQLLKLTDNLRKIAEMYEYLGREVLQTGTLIKLENGFYGISDSDIYYRKDSLIEYYDKRYNHYDISTVNYDGTNYYIVGYPLQLDGTSVRIRGYRDDKQV